MLWVVGREEVGNGVLINRLEVYCVSGDQCGGTCVAACVVLIVDGCGGLLVVLRCFVVV